MTNKQRRILAPIVAVLGLLLIEYNHDWKYYGYAIMLGSMFFLMPWNREEKSK